MARNTQKLTSDRLQSICDVLDRHISEWHHAANVGKERGFDTPPSDDQVTTVLHAIGALTDILRVGMFCRQLQCMQSQRLADRINTGGSE